MELELPVIIVLTVIVVAVAYALGTYWRRRQGVFPEPPPAGLPKTTGAAAAPISDREVRAVVSWLLSQAFEQTGIRVADDRLAYQRIVEAAQKAVVELKTQDTFDVSLPYLTAD